jgi:hypothetical protein
LPLAEVYQQSLKSRLTLALYRMRVFLTSEQGRGALRVFDEAVHVDSSSENATDPALTANRGRKSALREKWIQEGVLFASGVGK